MFCGFRSMVGETGVHSLVSALRNAMTQSENTYRQFVFLQDLRQQKDRQQQIGLNTSRWLSFLQRRGLVIFHHS